MTAPAPDPVAIAAHRKAIVDRRLPLLTAARACPELTAAVLRQVLAEAPKRDDAAALLGLRRDALLRAIAILPELRAELDAQPGARSGWSRGADGPVRRPRKNRPTPRNKPCSP